MDSPKNVSPEELYPLALLMDELKNDDITLRLNAMHRLPTIAMALGAERTRVELVPFLEEVAQEDEDEVLTALAAELGSFVPYVGGPEFGHVLLPSLEALSCVEEPVVRDKAVESLNKICQTFNCAQVEEHFVSLVKKLASAEWFSNRVAATGLCASVISNVNPECQQYLLELFSELVKDDAPMVRRSAATKFPEIVAILPEIKFEGTIYNMFKFEASDDQDSVRLLAVDVLIAIAKKLKEQKQVIEPSSNTSSQYNSELISFAISLFDDKSWRVRYMAADRFESIASYLECDEMKQKFVTEFIKLLKDTEAEVRTAISKQIPGFCKHLTKEIILDEVIVNVEELSRDPSQHVRAALASEVAGLAPLLGKDMTIEHLLPTFLQMLKDEFPDVRLNIISKLHLVNDVIGIELLSQSLLPAISELAQDKQWRVRLAIIEYIPLLADQLGVKFFDKELGPLCMTWLWDSVYSIREAANANLKKLTKVFGVSWAKEEILPHIIVVGSDSNYLYRLTALFAVTALIPVVDEQVIQESILPFITELINDPIPNIRFNVAKSYRVLIESMCQQTTDTNDEPAVTNSNTITATGLGSNNDGHSTITYILTEAANELAEKVVIPNLSKLTTDADVDVRFFAQRSLEAVNAILHDEAMIPDQKI
ncbi:ARM repeat-containing protein [Nadsonia fulvescens var. elongata DSM 6958]|uniref:ARM repeat-containing protein n=1 Tax=Nadsonia fulvescens var. elongata DSM 6958 TaxID=857566 RepID=A0A1E3PGV7_9ASCO|nr:ARM repeat-containing protein [Nadsonia fulvescens var. elongata DSM 6958]